MRDEFDDHERRPVERLIERDLDEATGKGRPLSDRARQYARSVEAYLQGGVRPRWMERAVDIDGGIARERRLLESAYEELRAACARDGVDFAGRWRELAAAWPFPAELLELIDQHNEWYPIERDLPLNPRTGRVRARRRALLPPSGARPGLDPEQFPAGS